jgi:hypothetical protein
MICDNPTDIPHQPSYPSGHCSTETEHGTREEAGHDNMIDSVTATLVHRPKVSHRVTFAEINVGLKSEGSHSDRSDSAPIFMLPGIGASVPAPVSFHSAPTQQIPNDDFPEVDQDFMLVPRPKPHTLATIDEPMSSPEMIPTPVTDILAATGTDYSSDDEWCKI